MYWSLRLTDVVRSTCRLIRRPLASCCETCPDICSNNFCRPLRAGENPAGDDVALLHMRLPHFPHFPHTTATKLTIRRARRATISCGPGSRINLFDATIRLVIWPGKQRAGSSFLALRPHLGSRCSAPGHRPAEVCGDQSRRRPVSVLLVSVGSRTAVATDGHFDFLTTSL